MKEVEELKRLVEEKLRGRVLLVTIFGSRARGRATPLSDVDIAVLPASRDVDERLRIACDLAELASKAFKVPDDRVDVLFLDEDLPIELLFEAVARGILVYCSDRDLYADLRLRAISMYLDFKVFKEKLQLTRRFVEAVKRDLGGEARNPVKHH